MIVLRSLLFALWFGLVSAVMTLGCIPLLLARSHRGIIWAMRNWAALTFWGLRVFAGVRYEIRGRQFIPHGPTLVAAKHQSMWETIAFHLLLDDPAMVMKRELLHVPLYGEYAKRAEMIPVDREGHARTLKTLVSDARDRISKGRQIVIFPEGTRRAPGAPPDYKAGIAALYNQLGVPCVPAALNSGHFWLRKGFLKRPGTIVLEFLEPIPPGLKRPEFMATLEQRIETACTRLGAEHKD